MQLPIKIFPSPLLKATVEVRFKTKIDSDRLFSTVYPKFAHDLPKFQENKIPKEIRLTEPKFKFSPDYILQNNDFTLAFSNQNIAFDINSDYKLWDVYFSFIKIQLKKFLDLGILESVFRIGVRYINLFDGKNNLEEILTKVPKVQIEGYDESLALSKINLKKKDYSFHVQLASNAKAEKGKERLSGVYIDIDSSYNAVIMPTEEIFRIIDELHFEGKMLFFKELLNPVFLKNLNPQY